MLKKAALAFGIVLTLVGILGFIPALTTTDNNGMELLLGIFMVGTIHNIIHLASGLAALALSKTGESARLYFKIFVVIYAIVTVVGFVQGDTVLGLIHVNLADNLLHTAIALSALYLGFMFPVVNADRGDVKA